MPAFKLPFAPQGRRQNAAHQRFDLGLQAEIVLLPRDIRVEGMVLNVSRGGCLFRPFVSYLVTRTGDMVILTFNGHQIPSRIMNTNPRGYGVAFNQLTDLRVFGLPTSG